MYMMQECTQSRFLPCASITFCISSLLAAHKYSCKYICMYVCVSLCVFRLQTACSCDTHTCAPINGHLRLRWQRIFPSFAACKLSKRASRLNMSLHTHTHVQKIICALVCALCKRLTHSCCRRGSCTHRCNNARLQ